MNGFDNQAYLDRINKAAAYIREAAGPDYAPAICVVSGSGLADISSFCEVVKEIRAADIPGYPVSTAPGHDGKLIIARSAGKDILVISGRVHYYEGYDMRDVTMYVRVASVLGVKSMIVTNAAGGISEMFKPIQYMAITDHISFLAEPALRGPNLDGFGVRFPDQSEIYDKGYIKDLLDIASANGINLTKGIYVYTKGPQYETPAEIRMLKLCGADAVGMSTVPEVIVASHCGIKVAAISVITNFAAGITNAKLSEEEVLTNAGKAAREVGFLIGKLIERI
ncbi:MAG: purine-nucleoside phosphorylase [Clostridiales bacterium]|nr:purine-nucleoside phosphorylase [Clostridiales bacterium]